VLSGSAERRGNHLRVPAQKRGAGLVAGARADAGVRASADEADEHVPSQRTRGARALLVRLKEGERPTGRMTGGPSWSVRGKGGERLVGFAGTVMIGGPRVGVRMGQFGQGLDPKLDRLVFRNSFINRFRGCLRELHAASDPENQLRSKPWQPNTTSSSSSTVDMLQKNGGAGLNSMVFME
jgi:hypothetical protein